MKRVHWITAVLLALVLGLSGCGNSSYGSSPDSSGSHDHGSGSGGMGGHGGY